MFGKKIGIPQKQCRRIKDEYQYGRKFPDRATEELRSKASLMSEIRMRPRASHPGPHYACVPALPDDDCFGPTAPETGATFAEVRCGLVISRSRTCNVGPTAIPARKSGTGEEAATPGQPVALSRVSGCFPLRQFAFAHRRCHLALPQPSGKLRNSHVSLNPLSIRLLRAATQKGSVIVQKLWRTGLLCGRRWKTKNPAISASIRVSFSVMQRGRICRLVSAYIRDEESLACPP